MSAEYGTEIDYNLLFTLFDGREGTSQRYLIEYGGQYKDKLFPVIIKRNADVKNAVDMRKSIFDIPKAAAREDFDLLAWEILRFPKPERRVLTMPNLEEALQQAKDKQGKAKIQPRQST